MIDARTTHIETLHLRGAGLADAPGLRLAASAWLGTADLHPPGLSPSAVLVVRALPDPMPRGCGTLAAGSRPHVAWTQAVRQALDDVAHRAARPSRGRLPPRAEAVYFADRAEWMACLALDLARNAARERWWWRASLYSTAALDRSARVATALSDPPTATPAVLAHLAAWQSASDVLRALTTADARRVLDRTAEAFGMALPDGPPAAHAMAARATAAPRPDPSDAGGTPEAVDASDAVDAPSPRFTPVEAPWGLAEAAIPPDVSSRVHTALFGVGLTLYRRAALVSQPSFAEALARWWTAPSAREDGREPNEGGPGRSSEKESLAKTTGQKPHPPREMGPASLPEFFRARSSEGGSSARKSSGKGLYETTLLSGRQRLASTSGEDAVEGNDAVEQDAPPARSGGGAAAGTPEHAAPGGFGDSALRSDAFSLHVEPEVLGTELGGVLYLINLMVRLELPEVYEDAHRLASTAGPWGVLEAVARGLLGRDVERFPEDGLWTALARLDDRTTGTPPGATFPIPDAFACPPFWIEEGGGLDGPLRWHASGGRLRVWTDAYLLADRPQDGADPAAAARSVARGCGARPSGIHVSAAPDPWHGLAGPEAVAPGLAWWTARAGPFLRHRVTQALDLSPDADLTAAFLAVPGVLHLSSLHVDWTAPLEAASLAVRLAGLDRDPGWVPSFGRVVLFHFD